MNDILYRGCSIRPRAFPVADDGFGSKVLVFSSLASRWTQLHIGGRHFPTEAEALSDAVEVGRRIVDSRTDL